MKAILFDLDGTLLPMEQKVFSGKYFEELAKKFVPFGMEPKELTAAVRAGTKAMVKNDGSCKNEQMFWDTFCQATSMEEEAARDAIGNFYTEEFHNLKVYTKENPLAAEAIRLARKEGRKVILASNPLFPLDGQASRLSWARLSPEDFDWVTSYEEECYCKPNPKYYTSVCEKIGIVPEDCLMIGNDDTEDMQAAAAAGLNGYLVTDCRIKRESYVWDGPKGTFEEMMEMLRTM